MSRSLLSKTPTSLRCFCYEASGCGFWIARRLLQMGVRCEVIAPSLIPTKSGDRVKTDKRDSMKLAKSLRSNDLVPVNIPDSVDEAIRAILQVTVVKIDEVLYVDVIGPRGDVYKG